MQTCVDLVKSFPTSIYLQTSASIQPRTFRGDSIHLFIRPLRKDDALSFDGARLDCRAGARAAAGHLGCFCGVRVRGLGSAKLANFAKFCKFLAGSFSAVSKRNFARKYAFDSIFQALRDLHTFAPLQSQNFSKKSA